MHLSKSVLDNIRESSVGTKQLKFLVREKKRQVLSKHFKFFHINAIKKRFPLSKTINQKQLLSVPTKFSHQVCKMFF